jgi:ferrous iron transport protein B
LAARSLDEQVAVSLLNDAISGNQTLDGVLVVIDATAIERNLYLLSQIMDSGLPIVVIANMCDRMEKAGVAIELDQLRGRLALPIVTTCACKRQGIDDVKHAMVQLTETSTRSMMTSIFPAAMESAIDELDAWQQERRLNLSRFQIQRLIIDFDAQKSDEVLAHVVHQHRDEVKVKLNDIRSRLATQGLNFPTAEPRLRHAWIRQQLNGIVTRREPTPSLADRIDHVLTHRWFGLLFFVALMFVLFQLLYSPYTTGYLSSLIEIVQGSLQGLVEGLLAPGPLRSLLNDGIIAGIGSVLVFVPQIAVLFLMFAILEDCGYMARVAMVMDRLMSKLGLNGKAFLPLMTSFGCAVPGILATRTIANRSDRLVTMLVAPLMSCSARLPVYTLMTYAFIPEMRLLGGWLNLQGIVLIGMMMLGAIVAIPVAWAIRKFLLPGESSSFIMELPTYKLPSWRVVYMRVRDQVIEFIKRAGTLIFCTAIVVWALLYFPGDRTELYAKMQQRDATQDEVQISELDSQINAMNAQLVRQSILGRVGLAIEPLVKPLGWDWRIGVGVLASFPAREVIIATLGTIFALGGDIDEESVELRENLAAAKVDGRPLMNVAVALSVMVFFALCMQCAATLAVLKRESGSWKWPIFTFVYMTALAYLGSLITYQVASSFT